MKAGSLIKMNNTNDYEEINIKAYLRLIGKLIYLLCDTRSEISFVIGQLSR